MSYIHQDFTKIIRSNFSNNERKIVSLPLTFDNLTVDILAKQFTKLNSQHQYRIHYLGPRFCNTQGLHRKYASLQESEIYQHPTDHFLKPYRLNWKKILTSLRINQQFRNKNNTFYRAFQGMNPTLDISQEFVFDSVFQSGNLDCVIKLKPNEFDCFLRIDSNTRGHLQWFYFSIKNGNLKQRIKINICNISKNGNLYSQGHSPFIFSKKFYQKFGQGWTQNNKQLSNLSFQKKAYNYQILQSKVQPNCLSFQFDFTVQQDEVFFAYCVPYTYSQMLCDIQNLPKKYCQIDILAKSFTGVDVPILSITERNQKHRLKKNILITARIHPSQTNSSHMLNGFLKYVCSEQQAAINFRERANIFVIPMINPDGVILGNSRTNATGNDLNRVYPFLQKQMFPQIFQIKNLVKKLSSNHQILLFYDFHGHSGRKNTFFFGPSYPINHPNYYKARILPKIIENIDHSFRYHSCSFVLPQGKKATGRACMFLQHKIPFTYTIQSSIGLYYNSQSMKTHKFDIISWQKMGAHICQGTSTFLSYYQQYQELILERKLERQIKALKGNKTEEIVKEKLLEQKQKIDEQKYKNKDKNKKEVKFLSYYHQIKHNEQKHKKKSIEDEDISSDEHDDHESLQQQKIIQFRNLISKCYQTETLLKGTIRHKRFNSSNQATNRNKMMLNRTISKKILDDQETVFFEEMRKKTKSSGGRRQKFGRIRTGTQKQQKILTTKQQQQIVDLSEKKQNRIKVRRGSLIHQRQEKTLNKITIQQCSGISSFNLDTKNYNSTHNKNKKLSSRRSNLQANKISKISYPSVPIQQYGTKTIDLNFCQFMQGIQKRSKGIKNSIKFIQNKKLLQKSLFLESKSFVSCKFGCSGSKANSKKKMYIQRSIDSNKYIQIEKNKSEIRKSNQLFQTKGFQSARK